jgi:hypothetical protein
MTALYSAVLGAVAVGFALLAGSSGPPADGEAVWLIGRGLFLPAVAEMVLLAAQ